MKKKKHEKAVSNTCYFRHWMSRYYHSDMLSDAWIVWIVVLSYLCGDMSMTTYYTKTVVVAFSKPVCECSSGSLLLSQSLRRFLFIIFSCFNEERSLFSPSGHVAKMVTFMEFRKNYWNITIKSTIFTLYIGRHNVCALYIEQLAWIQIFKFEERIR